MDERATMKEIAQRVLDGELRPGAGAPAATATEGPSGPATQAEGAQAEGV
jgi:hypothetical protein